MPVLSNPRHERFAQELANGKTAAEAHAAAGYKPNKGNPSTLKADERISHRVAELLAERDKMHAEATEKATERLSIDREWVLAQLVENVRMGKDAGDLAPANKALELLGKELGMFIERTENINTNYEVSADLPTAEEWEAEHSTAH